MKHFKFEVVPANRWRRIQGTNPKGPDGPRPHFVPVTQRGRQFAGLDSFVGCRLTDMCPGKVLIDKEWATGYRFIEIPEAVVPEMLADLNKAVEKFFASI